MPQAQTTAPSAQESPAKWLSVADFAKLHNRSNRTVKRWIEDGEVETKKDGAQRYVRAKQEGHESATDGIQASNNSLDEVTQPPSVTLESGTQTGHTSATNGTQEGHTESDTTGTQTAQLSPEREVQYQDEIRFLRGLVEQHQRSEAELRAALRDALKMSTRQLTTGEIQPRPESPVIASPGVEMNNVSSAPQQRQDGQQTAKAAPSRRGEGMEFLRLGIRRIFGR